MWMISICAIYNSLIIVLVLRDTMASFIGTNKLPCADFTIFRVMLSWIQKKKDILQKCLLYANCNLELLKLPLIRIGMKNTS